MHKIVNDFEGANIRVLSQNESAAHIAVELRDTVDDWFFWCFRVDGAEGKTVTFEFENRNRVGYFGAAVSRDLRNWHWQYDDASHQGGSFTYTFGEDETSVYFAHDMVYRPERFYDFATENKLEIKTLCTSEKGRAVPYLDFGEGDECILLTARHHACESTGNYVLEGVLSELINRGFDKKFRIICVPMVDFDGVCDGDQGKNRNNHDHNRDYVDGEAAIYAATREIRRIASENKIRFAFDFHSPWHLGDCNDTVFFPIKHYSMMKKIAMFSALFEDEATPDALPYFAADNYEPDRDWNKSGTPCFGTFMGSEKIGAELAFTVETAYFHACGVMFTPERAEATGRNFVRALERYLGRGVRVGITGDLLYQNPINEQANGDYRALLSRGYASILNCDFLIGNPETPFAEEVFGYTDELYCFNTPESALRLLKKIGFDLLTFANNHCMDRDYDGLLSMCRVLRRNDMDYIGISDSERNSVYIKDFGGFKVSFVNLTYGTNAFAHHNFLPEDNKLSAVLLIEPEETLAGSIHLLEPLDNIASEVERLYNPDCDEVKPYMAAARADIEHAKRSSDYVVALLHSGGQYNVEVDAFTRLMCARLREFGADTVIANHPHIILPCEIDESGYFTAYSLGNMQSAWDKDSLWSTVNPEFSAMLYITFDGDKKHPKFSFSIMKSVIHPEQEVLPVTYNAYDLYRETKDESLRDEALHFANIFAPNKNYTELKREFEI